MTLARLAAAVLNGSMLTAIRKVHLDKGVWNTGGGYEYNLALIVGLTALVEAGGRKNGQPGAAGPKTRLYATQSAQVGGKRPL